MGDRQCGLCLSCSTPFLNAADDVEVFNRDANLSMLYLNSEFKKNPDILRTYDFAKFCSERQSGHMIHKSFHHTALDYMTNRHTRDSHVGVPYVLGAVAPPPLIPRTRIQDAVNVPILYYHTATGNAGAMAATWQRPSRVDRIVHEAIFDILDELCYNDLANHISQDLKQRFDVCFGCNMLMTQKSHMRFLLGVRGAGAKNGRGAVLPRGKITQYQVKTGRNTLDSGYGHWTISADPPIVSPTNAKTDSDAPCIAYYLHMCLPYDDDPNRDPFEDFHVRHKADARALYLQLSWIVLEIACLATLLQEGTVTKANSKRSHGMHQHRGVLDLYVSYFLWRLIQFEHGPALLLNNIDFYRWHQIYFSDSRNCPGFLSYADRQVVTGRLMFGATDVDSKVLLLDISTRLVGYYRSHFSRLALFLTSPAAVPAFLSDYFPPPASARILGDMSLQVPLSLSLFPFFSLPVFFSA